MRSLTGAGAGAGAGQQRESSHSGGMSGAGTETGHCRQRERGAVTAEMAVGLPALTLLLAALLTGAAAGVTQLRVQEAARTAAREVLRGQDEQAVGAARRVAGDGAAVEMQEAGGWVQVEVSAGLDAPLLRWLPVTLRASAAAPAEDGP